MQVSYFEALPSIATIRAVKAVRGTCQDSAASFGLLANHFASASVAFTFATSTSVTFAFAIAFAVVACQEGASSSGVAAASVAFGFRQDGLTEPPYC